jgi:hypothetical protein
LFWVTAILSVLIAFFARTHPERQMPIDYGAIMSRCLPLACVWTLLVVASSLWFGRRAFWMLLAAPIAWYWPLWRLFNELPACYYSGNCA